MTEKEFLRAAYIRTVVACLEVASYTVNQIKQGEVQKAKQKLNEVEKQIDGFLKKIRLSVQLREGKKDLAIMNKEFDNATNFMNEIIAISSIIPNNPSLQQRIIDRFNEVCKEELER